MVAGIYRSYLIFTVGLLVLSCGSPEYSSRQRVSVEETPGDVPSDPDQKIQSQDSYAEIKSPEKTTPVAPVEKKPDPDPQENADPKTALNTDLVEEPEEPEEKPGEKMPELSPLPPQIESSKGTGGIKGMGEVTFTASNNLSSSYKINAPVDSDQKIYGLHIHLHGDGGGGYRDFPNKDTRYDLIGVTVLSPNNGQSWNRNGQGFSIYLNELVQNDLLKKYDIDLKRIYFSSVSGGSYFLTGAFIPLYGKDYKSGGAFMMCGGKEPDQNLVPDDFSQTLKDFRLHWQSTNEVTRNDIKMSVDRSIASYKALLGAEDNPIQTSEIAGNFGHCEFDGVSYTTGIQDIVDKNFKVILPPEFSELAQQ